MLGCPHECAYHSFREEVASGIASFNASNLDVRRDTDNTDSIRRRRNCAGSVCAVAVVIVRRDLPWDRYPADAVHTISIVDVRCEVGMGVIEAGVNIAYEDRGTATRDGMRLRCMDLNHIPLQTG